MNSKNEGIKNMKKKNRKVKEEMPGNSCLPTSISACIPKCLWAPFIHTYKYVYTIDIGEQTKYAIKKTA